MHVFVSNGFSQIVEGIVLAVGRNRLRIAVRDWQDAVEIIYRDGRWVTEDGRELRLESLISDGRCNGDLFKDCIPRFYVAT